MKDAFALAGYYPSIKPGDVWKAKDSIIRFFDSATRHWHNERYCLVLTNDELCADRNWPVVSIAPMSSKLSPLAKPDMIIRKTDKNGLEVDSRLILSQPISKTDLIERQGEVGLKQWDEVMMKIFWHYDRA